MERPNCTEWKRRHQSLILLAIVLVFPCRTAEAWVSPLAHPWAEHSRVRSPIPSSTRLNSLDPTLSSLIAGSIAGAIGVGVAFPLDTIKTKQQVLSAEAASKAAASAARRGTGGRVTTASSTTAAVTFAPPVPEITMLDVTRHLYATQGVGGFFGGVQSSMLGQAVIKAVAFGVNSYMLNALLQQDTSTIGVDHGCSIRKQSR